MKIFISWSGKRSQQLALNLRDWLPLILYYVAPWVSEADIGAGDRWASEVGKELESSNFGIICLTRENIESQWILFEAGSLAKSLQESKVIPLLLDLDFSEISGPLAQFQGKKTDKESIIEVIKSINQSSQTPIDNPRLDLLFNALWPKFEETLKNIPDKAKKQLPVRPQHEILEELILIVRSLDQRTRVLDEFTLTGLEEEKIKQMAIKNAYDYLIEAIRLFRNGEKIQAIKAIRQGFGIGLKESKDLVESF